MSARRVSARRADAVRGTAVGAVGVFLLAGGAGVALADDNGIAAKSAAEIAAASRRAMSTATSMRMVAEVTDASGKTALDLRFDVAGNCVGTVRPPGASGGRADVIKRGDDVWMRLDEALLRSQVPGAGAAQDAIALIDGRYLHGTTDSALLKGFAEFCDLDTYKDDFSSKPPDETLTKGGRVSVGGRPAVNVTSAHDGEKGTFSVSTEDKPHLLRLEGTNAEGERTTAVFSEFDAPVRATPPPASQSVDLSRLQ
ncbi:hypothetical protein LG634_33510 [Streptomyces bambusae]|uniref:hypothetical protein n=1 Tax=Streptomyces bambusae TaxID=1550616 RepID=UPI001CFFD051|nr:hypothetical protein [Streptomyces bambusae]MCB5169705.1 hypothetical protein [Streptomyces bambusae]